MGDFFITTDAMPQMDAAARPSRAMPLSAG